MATTNVSSTLVTTAQELKEFLSTISASNTLYLDLEGKSLGRHGTICIISILVYPEQSVQLIDVTTLGKATFTTTSDNKNTLKSILEDSNIVKCLWDCRNDADALLALYQVSINGVVDIQLLENATRSGPKTYLCGLAKAIDMDLKLKYTDRVLWTATKNAVSAEMANDVFAKRPMDDKTFQYCVNDIIHLPALRALYSSRLTSDWAAKVKDAIKNRLAEIRSPHYQPESDKKKFGPWDLSNGKKTLSWDEWEDLLQDQAEDEAQGWDELENILQDQAEDEAQGWDELENILQDQAEDAAQGSNDFDDRYDDYDDLCGQTDDPCYGGAFDECWDKY
ncbi:3 -5 exonuclease [Venturia nashicola]|uniref:3-5 exonuclease n=1 Tax=Venturia nashicola TaxID=86259 RepID=A0A4Z1NSK9_9PEZI|nr:3 -5 exonuclease [Venturia nashicola]TLD18846.1 3 -5 exonuclease [Venturia nashicola]